MHATGAHNNVSLEKRIKIWYSNEAKRKRSIYRATVRNISHIRGQKTFTKHHTIPRAQLD